MSKTVVLRLKSLAMAGGAVVLLTVVALAAGSLPGDDATAPFIAIEGDTFASAMRQVLFVLYLALLASALYLLMVRPSRTGSKRRARRASPLVTVLSLLLLGVVWFTIRDRFPFTQEGAGSVGAGPPATGEATAPAAGDATAAVTAPGWELVVLAVMGLVAIGYLFVSRRRVLPRPLETTASPPPGSRSTEAPPPTTPGDPRGRVFAAYRVVESMAGRSGVERATGDTVGSHLRRLADLVADAPGRLAHLYNRARFSPHSITLGDAEQAEGASAEITERLS
ncbi:MAG TPA: DUF4129 domain-containing protein [Acidimicrobiia bacterium]|nr:DUF4129 domain-containing protein [Acidimicrobiia bacterium]